MEAAPAVFQGAWPVASSRFVVDSTSSRCAPRPSNPSHPRVTRVLSTMAVGLWAVSPWRSRRSRPSKRAQSEDTEETPTPEAPEAPEAEVTSSPESDAEFLAEFRKRVQACSTKNNI